MKISRVEHVQDTNNWFAMATPTPTISCLTASTWQWVNAVDMRIHVIPFVHNKSYNCN